jgi:CheY-like chemotaxis protein
MSTILLIDDEEDIRDSVKKVLEKSGYSVITASSAEKGLALMQSHIVHAVITDIIMPGIDGVDAIKTIREISPDVRILAISGGGNFRPDIYQPDAIATSAYLQSASDAGADGILTKPFQKSELLDKLRELLDS